LCENSDDLFFYARLDPGLRELTKAIGDRAFCSVSGLVRYRFGKHLYPDQGDWLQRDFEGTNFIDLIDVELEKIDSILDSCKESSTKRSGQLAVKPIVAHVTLSAEYGKRKHLSIIHALNIPRP